jgi:hypothetical protein
LIRLHEQMLLLREAGVLPATPAQQQAMAPPPGPFFCRVISQDIPSRLLIGQSAACTLWVHNYGVQTWPAPRPEAPGKGCALAVFIGKAPPQHVPLRHDVEPGTRTHFAFDFRAPEEPGEHSFRAALVTAKESWEGESAAAIICRKLTVTARS